MNKQKIPCSICLTKKPTPSMLATHYFMYIIDFRLISLQFPFSSLNNMIFMLIPMVACAGTGIVPIRMLCVFLYCRKPSAQLFMLFNSYWLARHISFHRMSSIFFCKYWTFLNCSGSFDATLSPSSIALQKGGCSDIKAVETSWPFVNFCQMGFFICLVVEKAGQVFTFDGYIWRWLSYSQSRFTSWTSGVGVHE